MGAENVMKTAQAWHPADIKAAIQKKGQTLSGLALANGLNESACRASLCRYQSRKADEVIAAFLDVSLHALWPDRYDALGARNHVRADHKHERAESHRLSAGAR